jgi:putative Ca2+/H+ antiporter (TMEM165/GDT1 family)
MTGEFIKAFMLIFAAEMGDKTQILAMAFATRYSVKKVLLGIFIGSFLNHGIAVALGTLISSKIPISKIQIAAGAAFIFFALWTLRVEKEEDDDGQKGFNYGAVATVALAFFIGELGDKTQLAAITLGASSGFPLLTLVGTVTGMVVTGGLGIIVGKTLGEKIPEFAIKMAAALVFLIFGLLKLYNYLPSNYLTVIYVVPFIIILIITVSLMIYKLNENRKEGKISLYRKKAKELQDYYKRAREDISKICLGVDNCGACEESRCTVGQIKNLINKGLKDEKIEVDKELNESWKKKNFDEDKIRVSLIMTLNILKDDFNNSTYKNIHEIRKNLERMLFYDCIEEPESWDDYVVKLKKISPKGEKFVKDSIKN